MNARKAHPCDHCNKSFSSSHQLAQHIRIHTGEKPYKCAYCEKSFKQLSHVQQHTRLHTGERPYKCPAVDCGRSFIQLSNLQQHMRGHVSAAEKLARARDKAHFCSVCGKGFKAVANLLTHKCRGHTIGLDGQRSPLLSQIKERCPICQQLCSTKEVLVDHLRDHHYSSERERERERLYGPDPQLNHYAGQDQPRGKSSIGNFISNQQNSCPICGKSYVNPTSLKKHLVAAHGSAPTITGSEAGSSAGPTHWSCCVCKLSFGSENSMLCHMEQMRTDPRHQFEAQIVLSCAAAERRSKDGQGLDQTGHHHNHGQPHVNHDQVNGPQHQMTH